MSQRAVLRKEFRWNAWNIEQVTKHGLSPREVESVVLAAKHPWPAHAADGGWEVRGKTPAYRLIQVLFFVDNDDFLFVYHAM